MCACVRACVLQRVGEGRCSFRQSPAPVQAIVLADPSQVFLLQARHSPVKPGSTDLHSHMCPGGLSLTRSVAQIHDKHIFGLPGGASLTDRAARTIPSPAAGLEDVCA